MCLKEHIEQHNKRNFPFTMLIRTNLDRKLTVTLLIQIQQQLKDLQGKRSLARLICIFIPSIIADHHDDDDD